MFVGISMYLWPILVKHNCDLRGTVLTEPLQSIIVGLCQTLGANSNTHVGGTQVLYLLRTDWKNTTLLFPYSSGNDTETSTYTIHICQKMMPIRCNKIKVKKKQTYFKFTLHFSDWGRDYFKNVCWRKSLKTSWCSLKMNLHTIMNLRTF